MTMRAVRLYDTRDLRFETIDVPPDPPAGEVRLRVAYAGICGSDIHNFKTGQWITRKPSIAGHEFSGVVHAVGAGVTGFAPGDKVVADSRDYCGECQKSSVGKHHLCENLGFVGESRDGGYADFVDLPEKLLFKCRDDATLDVMTLAEPLAVALHALAKMQVAETPIFIIGCGPIGALSAMASKLTSDREILVCDQNEFRANLVAKSSGGTVVSLSDLDALSERNAGPMAHILDTTGSVTVISHVLNGLSDATLGLVGIGSGSIDFDPVRAVEREFTIVGCHAFEREMPQAIALLHNHAPDFKPLISHRIRLEDVPAEFARIAAGNASGIKTLIEIGDR